MQRPLCKACEQPVRYGDLACSAECEAGLKAKRDAAEQKLIEYGWVRDAEAPNVWRKDGMGVTTEYAMRRSVGNVLTPNSGAAYAKSEAEHGSV